MQARRDEILAKKAKLAELKRQRELRSTSSTRQSIGGNSDVNILTPFLDVRVLTDFSLLPQRQAEEKAVQSLTSTLNQYWMEGERVGLHLQDLRELGHLQAKAAVPTVF
jgi:hypothetical protein